MILFKTNTLITRGKSFMLVLNSNWFHSKSLRDESLHVWWSFSHSTCNAFRLNYSKLLKVIVINMTHQYDNIFGGSIGATSFYIYTNLPKVSGQLQNMIFKLHYLNNQWLDFNDLQFIWIAMSSCIQPHYFHVICIDKYKVICKFL